MNSIEFKIDYLFGRLHSFMDDGFYNYIEEANLVIKDIGIALNPELVNQICGEWSSPFGNFKYEGKEYIVMDYYIVYIDEENKIIIEDDDEFVEKTKKLLFEKDRADIALMAEAKNKK